MLNIILILIISDAIKRDDGVIQRNQWMQSMDDGIRMAFDIITLKGISY